LLGTPIHPNSEGTRNLPFSFSDAATIKPRIEVHTHYGPWAAGPDFLGEVAGRGATYAEVKKKFGLMAIFSDMEFAWFPCQLAGLNSLPRKKPRVPRLVMWKSFQKLKGFSICERSK